MGWFNHQLDDAGDFFLTPGVPHRWADKSHKSQHFSRMAWDDTFQSSWIDMNWWAMKTYTSFKFYSPRTHVCHHTETPILPVLNFTRSKSWNRRWFHRASTKGSPLLDLMTGMLRVKKWFLNVFSCLIKFRWRVNQNLNIPTPEYVNRHDVYKCIRIICIYASNVFMLYIHIYIFMFISTDIFLCVVSIFHIHTYILIYLINIFVWYYLCYS